MIIEDPAGTLGRSGLRNGDLVVAIDGTEITGEPQGYSLQRAAEAKGRGTFTVLRGGKRVDVDVIGVNAVFFHGYQRGSPAVEKEPDVG